MCSNTQKMRNPELLKKKYAKIYTRYNSLYWGELMREEEIYKILIEEFHLEKRTLYGIILKMNKTQEKEIA